MRRERERVPPGTSPVDGEERRGREAVWMCEREMREREIRERNDEEAEEEERKIVLLVGLVLAKTASFWLAKTTSF